MQEIPFSKGNTRGVRLPDVRVGSGTRRVGFFSSPEIIGYPTATSGTRINRIPVAIPEIQFSRVFDISKECIKKVSTLIFFISN